MSNEEIVELLCKQYPTARKGFIEVVVKALEVHAKKNNDYNPSNFKRELNDFETKSMFYDIRRKYNRLFHLVAEEAKPKVDEKLEDTVLDLGNYSFLFLEYLLELMKTMI